MKELIGLTLEAAKYKATSAKTKRQRISNSKNRRYRNDDNM